MMKTIQKLFLLLTTVFSLSACSSGGDDSPNNNPPDSGNTDKPTVVTNVNKNTTGPVEAQTQLEFPRLKKGLVLVHYAELNKNTHQTGVNYCVEWDSDLKPEGWTPEGTLRSQRWSCYQMHPGNSSSKTDRKPYNEGGEFSEYPNDPDLSSKYHFTSDPYRFSGYDHGHIIASADRAYSFNKRANTQTFYMTNMQPQINGFNAKVWANMEAQVRRWNNNSFRDTLYVVKGGTIDRWDQIITTIGSGQNKIPVPKYFFMALLCKKKTNNTNSTTGGYRALGFWIQHKSNVSSDLSPYVVNIDELERLTGIDFFCNLPDQYEQIVESLSREQVLRAWNLE